VYVPAAEGVTTNVPVSGLLPVQEPLEVQLVAPVPDQLSVVLVPTAGESLLKAREAIVGAVVVPPPLLPPPPHALRPNATINDIVEASRLLDRNHFEA
jgi:hypothetical protein